jgi:hypothetical protein
MENERTMNKTCLPILCLLLCFACAARAAVGALHGQFDHEFRFMPVSHTIADGTRGVIDNPETGWPAAGNELPVARGEAIIGIFRVDYAGALHLWGSLFSHDPGMRLMPGDTVIVPVAAPESRPAAFPLSLEPARIVHHFPAGHSYWAFINRGAAHGVSGAQAAAVNRDREPVGDFQIIYAGEYFSYGLFEPYELKQHPDYKALEIVFPAN